MSVCHTADGLWGETDWLKRPTAKCRLFPPAVSNSHPLHMTKNSKVVITAWSYGMYPKIGLGDWKLKRTLPSHVLQPPLPPFSPVDSPCWGYVIFDQRPVGSKDVDSESRERESDGRRKYEGYTLPCAFPTPSHSENVTVWLIRLNLQWLPSLRQTIHWINIKWRNRLVTATLQWGKLFLLLFLWELLW